MSETHKVHAVIDLNGVAYLCQVQHGMSLFVYSEDEVRQFFKNAKGESRPFVVAEYRLGRTFDSMASFEYKEVDVTDVREIQNILNTADTDLARFKTSTIRSMMAKLYELQEENQRLLIRNEALSQENDLRKEAHRGHGETGKTTAPTEIMCSSYDCDSQPIEGSDFCKKHHPGIAGDRLAQIQAEIKQLRDTKESRHMLLSGNIERIREMLSPDQFLSTPKMDYLDAARELLAEVERLQSQVMPGVTVTDGAKEIWERALKNNTELEEIRKRFPFLPGDLVWIFNKGDVRVQQYTVSGIDFGQFAELRVYINGGVASHSVSQLYKTAQECLDSIPVKEIGHD